MLKSNGMLGNPFIKNAAGEYDLVVRKYADALSTSHCLLTDGHGGEEIGFCCIKLVPIANLDHEYCLCLPVVNLEHAKALPTMYLSITGEILKTVDNINLIGQILEVSCVDTPVNAMAQVVNGEEALVFISLVSSGVKQSELLSRYQELTREVR